MANTHPANLGDVLKHLVLCDVLATHMPSRYLESHGGLFEYDLAGVDQGRGGVADFHRLADADPVLALAPFAQTVRPQLQLDGRRGRYPGSVSLANTLLPEASEIIAADAARQTADALCTRLAKEHRRGGALWTEGLDMVKRLARAGDVVLLDPFDLRSKSSEGDNAVDVALHLESQGVTTLLWYPVLDRNAEPLWDFVLRADHASAFWRGEIVMPRPSAGLTGCGIVAANLHDQARELVAQRFLSLVTRLASLEPLLRWSMWPASPDHRSHWGEARGGPPTHDEVAWAIRLTGFPIVLLDEDSDEAVGPLGRTEVRLDRERPEAALEVRERGEWRSLIVTDVAERSLTLNTGRVLRLERFGSDPVVESRDGYDDANVPDLDDDDDEETWWS
jgi:23S rRNA A2030 N6-methylase RlmJ